jgi:long-subunit fatty acid transport protein
MRLFRTLYVATSILCAAGPALANGLQLLPGGTESVGRGGAVAARPVDGMALIQNPAGLAFISGQQLMLEVDFPTHHMCVDPYGYYGWGVYTDDPARRSEFGDPTATGPNSYARTPLPRVCNSGPPGPLPHLTWVKKLTNRITIGAGFAAPTVVTGMQFGGADGTIETPQGPRPTPTRYSIVKQEAGGLDPVIGAAYRFARSLSLGMSFQVFMIKGTATAVQNQFGGTNPATDAFVQIESQDYFVPALTFSTHYRPIEALNFMAAFRWIDSFDGSGNVTYETNTYHQGARSGPVPYKNPLIPVDTIVLRQPWELTVGARFGAPLSGAKGISLGDPLDTERWDVELDATYYLNARASHTDVEVGHPVSVTNRQANGVEDTTPVENIGQFTLDRHLKDSMAVRLGGSFSVVPRELQVQAGAFYETRGVEIDYADIDTFAFRRIGTGVGAVLRVGQWDFKAGYMHIFSETIDLTTPPQQNVGQGNPNDPRSGFDMRIGGDLSGDKRVGGRVVRDPAAPPPEAADGVAAKTQQAAAATLNQPNRVINAGHYTAWFDVVSVGAVYHF